MLKELTDREFIDKINKLRKQWQERGEEMFLHIPEVWLENTHYGCRKGHVTNTSLMTELHGDRCLACGNKVNLIPPTWTEEDLHKFINE